MKAWDTEKVCQIDAREVIHRGALDSVLLTKRRSSIDLYVWILGSFVDGLSQWHGWSHIFVEDVIMTWSVEEMDNGSRWVRRNAIGILSLYQMTVDL